VQCYDSAIYAVALCLSVSVTSRCSTKTAKHRIRQTKPHGSPATLVLRAKDLWEIPPAPHAGEVA